MPVGTNTTPRILAAAKEFNIGKDTLVEFLQEKGYDVNSSPATKLSEDMYFALEEEFAKDKAAKRKSESISLPKGSLVEQINVTEDKHIKQTSKNKLELETEESKEMAEEKTITPEPVQKEEAPIAPEPPEEQPVVAPAEKEADQTSETTEDTPNNKTTKLDGPKVLDKIDLDALNQRTRPTKKVKKETPVESKDTKPSKDQEAPEPKPEVAAKVEPTTPTEKIVETPAPKAPEPEKKDVIQHIETKTMKLEGPKIMGKIELPVNNNTRPNSEKRKRKRIPVENKKIDTNKPSHPGGDKKKRPDNNKDFKKRVTKNEPQEIDAKEIQEKIKQTQAKLAGIGGKTNKQSKSKYRRSKREELAEKRAAEEELQSDKPIPVTEFISVNELASLLDVQFTDIISKCMSLGIMVSINQRLDAEVIELVASEFDKEVEFIDLGEQELKDEFEEMDSEEDMVERAPVVTIMGHVDHGKTSLLDYIRSASVVAGEAGGITQHIGAYKVKTESGKEITFLDTPGHEAFTAMRARGAKAADVAVIVIAADDAIMPQTREAISHAQAANLPMIFAINKIDKEGANPDKIKEQLSGMNILVEDWGGKFQSQEISAKKGLHIDELLEKILLETELMELKANADRQANGTIIEASLDKGRGYVTSVLVQGGTLEQGDMVLSGQYYGKVKAMFNERGQRVDKAGPSTPVQILGLNGAPQAGESFKIFEDETEAKNIANHRTQILREQGLRSRKHITLDEIGRRLALGNFKELNVIIKADFDGSAEALSDSLQKLSTEEVVVNVVLKGVGQISESDVMLASASDAIIMGFQVRASSQAAKVADQENIEIRYYSIIYEAIEEIKSAMEGMLEPTLEKQIVGNIEVRETFKISGVGVIAGCYVLDGKFTRQTKVNIIRDGIVIHTGELSSLKRFKDDVKEVVAGYECGLSIKNNNDIIVGDIIEGFEEVEIKRKLK